MLYRQLPKVKRYLAYLPEGPVIDWETDDLEAWLAPMVAHLKQARARSASAWGRRWSPRRWSAAQVKDGIADDAGTPPRPTSPRPSAASRRPGGQPAQRARLAAAGRRGRVRRRPAAVQLPDPAVHGTHDEADVLAGMNQLWRRNIKKAAKEGVVVDARDAAEDLKALPRPLRPHRRARPLHARGRCPTSRPCSTRCGAEEPDRIRLYLARHEGDLVAATICDPGRHPHVVLLRRLLHREARGPRLQRVQWAMIRDALAAGADVYDLRGITDTLDADDTPRRADPVQGRHRRRGRRVRRRVGPAAQPPALQGLRPLHEARRCLMSLTLNVDGDRWRTPPDARWPTRTPAWCRSPRATATASAWTAWPARPAALGVDTLAVGTYDELAEVATASTATCSCSPRGGRSATALELDPTPAG